MQKSVKKAREVSHLRPYASNIVNIREITPVEVGEGMYA